MEKNFIITPGSKVADVLDQYPQLEEVLVGMAPAFNKLKNPLLRKTIARITSLQQAAQVAGIPLDTMINTLRKHAGQEIGSFQDASLKQSETKPSWVKDATVVNSFDARDALEKGEHPVHTVLPELNKLKQGELYKLIAPFFPAPLVDKAKSAGVEAWTEKLSESEYHIFFRKTE